MDDGMTDKNWRERMAELEAKDREIAKLRKQVTHMRSDIEGDPQCSPGQDCGCFDAPIDGLLRLEDRLAEIKELKTALADKGTELSEGRKIAYTVMAQLKIEIRGLKTERARDRWSRGIVLSAEDKALLEKNDD